MERLDPELDLVAAVRRHLPPGSALDALRLLGVASHNHGVELLLVARQLARPGGSGAALVLLSRIDHLYRLVDEWYRRSPGAAARPYHFHGAALVACELTARGHPPRVVRLTGDLLGELYRRTGLHHYRRLPTPRTWSCTAPEPDME